MKENQSDEGVSNRLETDNKSMTDDASTVMRYRVTAEVGKNCATQAEGHRLFWLIWHDLAAGSWVHLDFSGVTCFSPPFFDALCGELLKHFRLAFLNQRIQVQNLPQEGRDILQSALRHTQKEISTRQSE
ncbi:STAS-like domain-containing protein [Alicyclobacillus sp. ALC3]|uniref:STAS-like domain-containing protein n=1 Tax=Alicyclobacillus sp. ALC3 TaxID=2796143 RepID=UPI002378E4CC|nr:STAS-like domain-containing protein [Alicyclobacillus sp. ALC3]WDL96584.1 STAS-like domain-containing protein [Alicyclobacillus sp. ALC3]